MQETEITVQVFNSLNEVKSILEKQGFAVYRKLKLNDYYFSKYNLEAIKNLPYSEILKNSFLIREVSGENYHVELCYKNKTLDENENVISEEKVKCNVDDFETAIKVLESAGLKHWCNIKQDMLVFTREHIEFALQDVEGLGLFIEFEENESMKEMTSIEKFEFMKNYLQKLGLKLGNNFSCKKVYMKLLNA